MTRDEQDNGNLLIRREAIALERRFTARAITGFGGLETVRVRQAVVATPKAPRVRVVACDETGWFERVVDLADWPHVRADLDRQEGVRVVMPPELVWS